MRRAGSGRRQNAMAAPRNPGPEGEALGLLETHGLVAAIEATDAMLKAANVRLIRQERTVPALITCTIAGETAAVRAAIDAGRAAAERIGRVVSAHVIPRPAADIRAVVGMGEAPAMAPTPAAKTDYARADYDAMTVADLRRLARGQADENFSGRTISKASKGDLVTFLRGSE